MTNKARKILGALSTASFVMAASLPLVAADKPPAKTDQKTTQAKGNDNPKAKLSEKAAPKKGPPWSPEKSTHKSAEKAADKSTTTKK